MTILLQLSHMKFELCPLRSQAVAEAGVQGGALAPHLKINNFFYTLKFTILLPFPISTILVHYTLLN